MLGFKVKSLLIKRRDVNPARLGSNPERARTDLALALMDMMLIRKGAIYESKCLFGSFTTHHSRNALDAITKTRRDDLCLHTIQLIRSVVET